MNDNIYYLPGVKEKQVVIRLVKLGGMIHNDITRYTTYKNKPKQGTELLIKKCKTRLLDRLEKVIKMQVENQSTDEEWTDILKRAVEQLYGNNPPEEVVKELIGSFLRDISKTKVHYVRTYMNIIARIPENQLSIPFTP